jgi:hypothetical protein
LYSYEYVAHKTSEILKILKMAQKRKYQAGAAASEKPTKKSSRVAPQIATVAVVPARPMPKAKSNIPRKSPFQLFMFEQNLVCPFESSKRWYALELKQYKN